LKQFRLISPNLYNRIDSIKDSKGRVTDVYVKFIPREEAVVMAGGITSMSQSDDDKDACFSEYGKHTVSIQVWIFSQALFALAHEFGHVNYQVPNMRMYTEYYKRIYRPYVTASNHVGHSANDRSGTNALTFEREFKRVYLNYLKLKDEAAPLASPMILASEIRKRIDNIRY
jgi:hypothetical protein